MFKCENPDCGKEHDGTYGSGRFCSIECGRHYGAIMSAKSAIKNGNKHCPTNFKPQRAPTGTWNCKICGIVFETRALRNIHNKQVHPDLRPGCLTGHAWNHGLTKETCTSIANAAPKISAKVKQAVVEGRCTGRGATPEKRSIEKTKNVFVSFKQNYSFSLQKNRTIH